MSNWYNDLPENTKTYRDSQPIYYGRDVLKSSLIGAAIGLVIGILIGFELAYQPVITTFKPLVG